MMFASFSRVMSVETMYLPISVDGSLTAANFSSLLSRSIIAVVASA